MPFLWAKRELLSFDTWFVNLCDKAGDSLKKLFKAQFTKNFLGIIFVLIGFLFLYKLPTLPANSVVEKREPIQASKSFEKKVNTPNVVRILFPNHDIDLPVIPAKIVKGYWETSETSASQGEGTSNPGNSGNIVIFAHARQGLFYNLKDVVRNDLIYVFTKDKWYRYKVGEIKKVFPNDIAVVSPTKKEVLTLFTCSGFFDEKRLIVKAYPVK